MKRSTVIIQILWLVSAALLFCGAVIAIHTPETDLLSLTVSIGVLIVCVSKINIFIGLKYRKQLFGSASVIADGLLATFVSLLLLFDQVIDIGFLPILFGTWEILSGVFKVIEAKNINDAGIRGWHRLLGIGCIEVISGVALLLNPVDELIGINGAVSTALFMQSIGFLFRIFLCPHLIREEA